MFKSGGVYYSTAYLFQERKCFILKTKTITDVKSKLINAIDDIDTSKVTICDLKILADTVSVLAGVNDKPFDFMEAYSKISAMGFGVKQTTLSDLKEVE